MAFVRMITGTARSGRAGHLDALLLERLGESLLVVPTSAYARRRAGQLLKATGTAAMLDPPVVTFGELAKRILRGSSFDATPIGPLEQRMVLHRAIARARAAGSLDALGAASDSEGFLDHLLTIIGQLKQAAIEPKQFRQHIRARRHAMDGIVAEVYTAYQDELKQSGSVDLQGLYWLARIACEGAARPAELATLRRLLFDDFDDFTPSEFEVIRALSAHVDELAFGLNLSDDPERKNLYALPLGTRDALRRAFPDSEMVAFDAPAGARQSEFIAASLLVRKESPAPPDLTRDVTFVECHTLEHEIESIARRIKHLVRTEGTLLPDIAVVWRNTASVAAPMREIFREFGIPVAGLEGRTLAESAAAGFVLRFLNAAQSWTSEAVLDVLTSPWFSGPVAVHAHVFPILIRAARVRPARHGWRGSLERLARYLEDPKQIELKRLIAHVPNARAACSALQDSVAHFAAQCDGLLRPKPIAGHVEALRALMDAWPMAEAAAAMPAGDEREVEELALSELSHALGLLGKIHASDSARVDLGRFAQLLRRAFSASAISTSARDGAVACLGMEPARYLHFEHVFLAGLTDAHVPAGRKLSAIYTDDERADLGAAGVALDHAETHNQREVLLFQRMFTIAQKRLTVSWHRLAPGGKSVQRSLYLNEIADRLGSLDEQKASASEDIFLPTPDAAACRRDFQNLALVAGDTSQFPECAAAARIEGQRYAFSGFDAHDGVLADAHTLAWLREAYGDAHVFSASQLEAFADCPFRFFQERVLDLLDIESAEQAFDHLARGLVLHGALQQFHTRFVGRTIPEIESDEAAAAMRECAGAAFDLVATQFRHLPEGVLAAERARTIETLLRYERIARDPDNRNALDPWPPERFEVAFGQSQDADLPSFTLDTATGTIRLSGRIDRIDRKNGQFRLIDYKSSPIAAKPLESGKIFQLALYALAAEAVLLPGEQCADALYVPVGHDKNPRLALSRTNPKAAWDERIARAKQSVAEAVAGIRAGRFHPTLDKTPCNGCASQKVCRFERARMRRKAAP